MVHAFNPIAWEAEAGGFLSLRPAWDSQGYKQKPCLEKPKPKKKKSVNSLKFGFYPFSRDWKSSNVLVFNCIEYKEEDYDIVCKDSQSGVFILIQ